MANLTVLDRVKSLKKMGLADSSLTNIQKWLEGAEFEVFRNEIIKMIEDENVNELNDAFYKVIPFGTGGRRGKMGAGTNRINVRTIAESVQGFSEYLIECLGKEVSAERGVVVTYDARHHSVEFAKISAQVFAANGIKVYFFGGVRSTPQLSFTIRHMKAIGGVMISASHNLPSDNGIKVYWTHGGQVVAPHDANIIKKVTAVREIKMEDFEVGLKNRKIVMLDANVDKAYAETVGNLSLGNYRDVHVVFTPLNGCASTSFLPVLRHVGFKQIDEVKEQMNLDPDFSGVTNQIPNPEVRTSMDIATAQAKKAGADLVLASDPDADRIGVVSRESLGSENYIFLNGNQIGVLIFDYITRELKKKNALPANGVLVKTVVTTDLLTKIADDNNLETISDLPVGFKYIADAMENRMQGKTFLFGAEESHGYLYGDYARDKDGAVAALLVCEYAAWLKKEGRTLYEQLENIKREYGYYRELLLGVFYKGMDGMEKMQKIMNELRRDMPTEIAGLKVVSVLDQLKTEVFPDNALVFYLNSEKTIRLVVRPSGTEPKVKYYAAVGHAVGIDKSDAEYELIRRQCDELALKILDDISAKAENISAGGKRFDVLG